jgi:hypothetical protein
MLIRRGAVERLISEYPESQYRSLHVYPPRARASENQFNLFECMIDPETRAYLSEDYAFCHRWRQIGGKVWLDTRSRLRHIGPYEFCGTPTIQRA